MQLRITKGFTLVELLVALAIISVLAALLLASVIQVRSLARRTRCLANLRQIAAAGQLYSAEHPGWIVPAYWGWSPAAAGWPPTTPPAVAASGPRRHWYQVASFAKSLNAVTPGNGRYVFDLLCPDASFALQSGTSAGYSIQHSYGINTTGMPGTSTAGAPDYWNAWKTSQIRQPAEKIHFIDAVSSSVNANGSFNATLRYFTPGWGEIHGPPNRTNIVAFRHARGANVLYYDGHAQWLACSAVYTDPTVPSTTGNKRQWEATRR
jgi:prepilin-type N-terminal cleavage/methylation domain-containing protein/prepilin-type processing-associated H-X9-DG protein